MDFYESKTKLGLLAILSLAFVLLPIYIAYEMFQENSPLIGFLTVLFAIFMGWVTYLLIKKTMNTNPYVTVTDSALILYVLPDHPVHVDWHDIQDYIFYEIHNNKFIGLVLSDEEKYSQLMPKKLKKLSQMNVKMGYPMYNITWGHLKEKDRLLEELNRRTPNVSLFESVPQ
ncbi:hypothetical protein JOC78_001621 [Bacillus ectoiniformans]|uniref:STM3941 family protein n=1 Tax=Bacillus ectoiniformans TaxID=1494429 RepID=UPI00195E15EE|nr:STM3941 family protein [Bacillus ectoiniformans]MBM7648675.1 hypothetical protein [Bacillus ectoiniformans]